ncbi:phosphate ABC transporter permease PstA [Streptomyces sp. MBT65]|uniref:phosphate ABC transporter permease PstA n=1 Tax=Streptomyces sp. MBT65 TaxID=1488395 RepID=UPI00190950ED|nr:phosphate ABC transporter permease PstA [Streptomyces sp. MBT65]MBK3578389.1 phosphate ABC transporter permease PstA [Streptomyces sp. MBT65]
MTVVDETRAGETRVDEPAVEVAGGARLPDVPRRIGGPTRSGVLALCGAAVSGLCVSVLLFGELAPFSGALGFAVTWYVVFLTVYGVLTGLEENGQAVRDRVMTVVLWTAAGLLFAALAMVVGFTLWRGREALTYVNFFHQDMQAAGPLDPLGVGGIAHAMVGTLLMITIALLITVPLGLACAVYLNQIPGRFSRFVRTIVEAMTALPSIVAGLMVYAVWVLQLGMEKSGLAAGFAISVMMLPIVIRAADVVLRLVPGTLTEAAEALGAPRWRTVWHVVLPTARSGLATAVILGTARGIGETSPVLLTAGFTAATNYDPLHGPMISLPLAVFSFVRSPEPAMIARGFGAAAVLMALVLVLFVIARVIGGRGPGQQTRAQARRTARASRRDVARFAELRSPGLSLFDAQPHESSATTPNPAAEPPAPDDDERAPQGQAAPDSEPVTNSARSGGEAVTEGASQGPTAADDGEQAPQSPAAPDDETATNSARSGGEAVTEGATASQGPTAAAPGPAEPAPDAEPAPQGPPAPGETTD